LKDRIIKLGAGNNAGATEHHDDAPDPALEMSAPH
jgi:hypothetical protein